MTGRPTIMPLAMGLAMGPLMLMMLHGMATGEGGRSGLALAVFAGAHVAVVAVVLVLGLFAARLSPGLRARLTRMHRPGGRAAALMLAGAAASALAVHLLHGGMA